MDNQMRSNIKWILILLIPVFIIIGQHKYKTRSITIIDDNDEGFDNEEGEEGYNDEENDENDEENEENDEENRDEEYEEGFNNDDEHNDENRDEDGNISNIEGLKSKGFPSIKDITKPILKPISKIQTQMMGIFTKIEQGFLMITQLPSCFLWYMLTIAGHICYLPITILVWIFGLSSIEKQILSIINNFDKYIHTLSGFHIIHFSDSVQQKCFFAKGPNKKNTKKKVDTKKSTTGTGVVNQSKSHLYVLYIIGSIIAIVICSSYISYLFQL